MSDNDDRLLAIPVQRVEVRAMDTHDAPVIAIRFNGAETYAVPLPAALHMIASIASSLYMLDEPEAEAEAETGNVQ